MSDVKDYPKLGLKAGLEIHQQLDSGKLFCACPGYLRSDEPDLLVKRKLHQVAGETGEIDAAVMHEAAMDKAFMYQYYRDTNCLVELDEEPPHQINQDALHEALKIALLLNCDIYQDTQIMRKTVIDGSNTSGFQRTVLIARDGYVETSFGKVPIDSVCLEEDSARIIIKDEKQAVYRLDRLGIPLVEIATAPALNNPEQIKEAALKLGEILRVCNVKRGIGTIRQDVNMSIKGHERVEIKGFQEPRMMVATCNFEIERQLKELEEGTTIGAVRNALEDGSTVFLRPMPGRARMYPETDLPLLHISREIIDAVKKKLPKLRNEIRDELKKRGLSDELVKLVLEGHLDEFSALSKVHDNPNLIAKMVALWPHEFASKFKKEESAIREVLTEAVLERVLLALNQKVIGEGEVKGILLKIAEGMSVADALRIERVDDAELEAKIRQLVSEKPGLREGAYMGLIIGTLGKDVDKRRAMEIVKKLLVR
ncbi:Glu-tRNA(Gln) amidotransferase subunit GatE [Candidatus Pacearchaeota archaeon]|nr:Glu-tRNA(Gln) amidotransferase subunit GatE [Candidatus Pacearchaeota archaeon]